jgi:4-hydroxythreonine-4-phosphate dehydrogenase
MLNIACKYCLENKFDALVTTPIQKSIINDSGIKFSGHTEYLAKICNINLPVMLLACNEFRIALVTTHLPLSDVSKTISSERIKNIIDIVINDMSKRFGVTHPRITVCGLNPHAGEDGYLGTEEKKIITPLINALIKNGYNVSGPIPADTAFREEERQKTDVYICMYHDQGLPVLKTLGFGETVNITLGLPIIRTSVDHGTALQLAGTGDAQCNSLLAAIKMAETMALNQLHIKSA